MKTVKLADLLKMWECQQCSYAHKRESRDRKLICGWGGEESENIPCCKVPQCGNWPEFYNEETFNQIKIPR